MRKEDRAAYMREYTRRNAAKINSQRRQRYSENREEFLGKLKTYLDTTPGARERKRERDRQYRRENSSEINSRISADRKSNPGKYRQWELNRKQSAGHKESKYAHRLRWIAANREKEYAHAAICRALKCGKVTKPDRCSRCGNAAPLHGHHYLGYAKEHRLDVIWLCDPCHKLEHSR